MASGSVTLHLSIPTPAGSGDNNNNNNPLPQLLHTPSGLALLELQGTINLPEAEGAVDDGSDHHHQQPAIPIGRIDFPDYRPGSITFDPASTAWMRRVYMYVGQHQRLTGEVKKLPRAVGVVRRRLEGVGAAGGGGGGGEELEVVEIVKYKIVFSSRPEPVGTA
ncbi:hypothetical protein DHEL01_v203596 [Diaporthe helianthi]|uniref:Chromosome transmission fidelity protein 8 n=1 Tax=Diaporthe helianthi TaxID=158607 RepID=A0A2P5I671_DIAHE|nr:hypothetical protein DHEL01_v203596 [Diaporthe helianthi]